MSSRPWMPLYTGDIERDTMHLGPAEYGIYMRLIIHAWQHNGAIPLARRKLCNITRCDPRFWWRFGAPIVQQFFDAVDGSTATHKRVLTELHRSDEISNKRKAAAQQMLSKRPANAGRLLTQSQSHSTYKNVTVTTQSKAAARSGSNGPRAAAVTIGERMGNYVWNGSRWAEADAKDDRL